MNKFNFDDNKKFEVVMGQRGYGKRAYELQLLTKLYDEGHTIIVLRKEGKQDEQSERR